MNHYNLYTSLGLEESISSAQAQQELSQRLAAGEPTNPGGVEELEVALAILGDPTRKEIYDARLHDPQADAPITPQSLRQLADMPVADAPGQEAPGQEAPAQDAPGQAAQAPAGASSGKKENVEKLVEKAKIVGQQSLATATSTLSQQSQELAAEYKKSSRKALLFTAIGTVLVTFLLSALAFTNPGEAMERHNVKKLVEKVLDANNEEDVQEVLRDSLMDADMYVDDIESVANDNNIPYSELYESDWGGDTLEDAMSATDLEVLRVLKLPSTGEQSNDSKIVCESDTELCNERLLFRLEAVYHVTVGSHDKPVGFITMVKIDDHIFFGNVNSIN